MPRFNDTFVDMVGGTIVQYARGGQQNEIARGVITHVVARGSNVLEIHTDNPNFKYIDHDYDRAHTEEGQNDQTGQVLVSTSCQMYFAVAPVGVEIPRATGRRRNRETLTGNELPETSNP